MELNKQRRLGVLLFGIGLLALVVALGAVSDANTRHGIGAIGVAVELVGVVIMLRHRPAP